MTTPRLLISAAHKSSGKTTITVGLCAALAARGLRVQPFKKGPDYIDPMWLTAASHRACYNLDPFLAGNEQMAASFVRHAANADISIVEGNKGLYDGLDLDGSNSNAAVAHLLGLPVVLVIDARGMTRGIAPLLLGYQAFDRGLNIAGVVLNNLGGTRHEAKLRAVIEHYTDIPVVGAVQRDSRLAVDERHLGLMPSAEHDDASAKIDQIARLISAQLDLDRILAIAASAPALPPSDASLHDRHDTSAVIQHRPGNREIRIGVARDKAFGFYYAEDIAAIEAAGATIVNIDTLHDRSLPEIDGLVIGGGFPEVFMDALEANTELRHSIAREINAGLPVYAECGGLMYLSRSLAWQGRTREMVGAIPGDTVMHPRPIGRGYVRLGANESLPWGMAIPAPVRGHEFHYSSLENLPDDTRFAWRMLRGHGVDGKQDGILINNLFASYAHLRGVDTWVAPFVSFVMQRSLQQDFQTPDAPAGIHERNATVHACA